MGHNRVSKSLHPVREAFCVLLLCLVGVAGACGACQPRVAGVPAKIVVPESQALIERARDASIILYANDDDRLVCAGTRISPTEIVTAYHCAIAAVLPSEVLQVVRIVSPRLTEIEVEDMSEISVSYATFEQAGSNASENVPLKDRLKGRFTYWDAEHDLAVLTTSRTNQPFVRLNADPLRVGQSVFAIGHPNGLAFAYTHGAVSAPCRKETEGSDACFTELDLTIYGGSSGGGLFNTAGELIGVCSAGYDRLAIAYFATPEDVEALLVRASGH